METRTTDQMIPTPEIVNYPIKRVGAKFVNAEQTMSPSLLWKLQQGVAEAKFKVLSFMAKEGYVPVDDVKIDFQVEVVAYAEGRAVDGEATDGKWIRVPVDLTTLSVAKYQGLTSLRDA